MNQRFPILAELMRALLVLALVLLHLSAATPAIASAPGYNPSEPVWQCGFADPPDHAVHAPWHACRTGADAVLPPPPTLAERVCLRPPAFSIGPSPKYPSRVSAPWRIAAGDRRARLSFSNHLPFIPAPP